MLYALVLSSLLGQAQVSAPPTAMEIDHHDVLAPIQVIPSRTLRKNVLSAELGWNSLTGLGLLYTRNIVPHFSLDVGAGVSSRVGQFGVRGRYNILTDNLTPFLGLGFMYGTGTRGEVSMNEDGNRDAIRYSFKVDRSPLVQGVAGLSWQTRGGLSLSGMLGWNQLLRRDNLLIKSGAPNDRDRDGLKTLIGSGPAIAMNIGYAF